ncbi:hypothetical protein MVES_003007 [Malassezia vespertilionis]|uniref:ABC1 atypical kinase-like domain-containing protein n=1 Tax=Malassezia vespertilionis TaxID=2020962 RepID=A0A2N1J920_9BASI|nr:hypothetical protein MVES_003007 [Malassezia vespertilionis]
MPQTPRPTAHALAKDIAATDAAAKDAVEDTVDIADVKVEQVTQKSNDAPREQSRAPAQFLDQADEPTPQRIALPTEATLNAAAPVPASIQVPTAEKMRMVPGETDATLFSEYDAAEASRGAPLRAARVPSSRIGRLLHYGSLGAGLAMGSASAYVRRAAGAADTEQVFLSAANVNRLVDKLSTMRGAALKLGQFLSIQDSTMLPPQVEEVLLRVQNSAHYMPAWQLHRVLQQELGEDWRANFASFDERPFAAASIGQVHSAVLADPFPSMPELAGQRVAVKVQFPGIAESISSDLSNIKWLFMASSLLPKGLFLESSVRVLQKELEEECDYTREAEMGRRFRAYTAAIKRDPARLALDAPRVVDALSTPRVLTTEFMRGKPLSLVGDLDQEQRDKIAQTVMELSLRELFQWRLMQTDPNWSNFLYNASRGTIELIDFGATRTYTHDFMDMWLCLLRAAVSGDRKACEQWSVAIGYLTGDEPQSMINAHVESMLALGEPFSQNAPVPYPFANQTITDRVRAQVPVMLRERHKPPPQETYSLNRKLSGAFLLCARLCANVDCRNLFGHVTKDYVFATGSTAPPPLPGKVHVRSLHTTPLRRELHTTARHWKGAPQYPYTAVDLRERWGHLRRPWEPRKAELEQKDSEGASIDAHGPIVQPDHISCVNCVYNLYADDLAEYKEEMVGVREKLFNLDPPLQRSEWDTSLGRFPLDTEAGADKESGIKDSSMAAFLALEKKLTKL